MGTNTKYPSMEWLVETFMHLKECCERMKIDNFNADLSDELPVLSLYMAIWVALLSDNFHQHNTSQRIGNLHPILFLHLSYKMFPH